MCVERMFVWVGGVVTVSHTLAFPNADAHGHVSRTKPAPSKGTCPDPTVRKREAPS